MDKVKDIACGLLVIPCLIFGLFGPSVILMDYFHNSELLIVGLIFGAYTDWMFMKGVHADDRDNR